MYDNLTKTLNPALLQKLGTTNSMKNFQDIITSDFATNFVRNILNYSISTIQAIIKVVITIGTVIVVSFFLIKGRGSLSSDTRATYIKLSTYG